MKKIMARFLGQSPTLYLIAHLFHPRLKAVRGSLQAVHDEFALRNRETTVAVDLGCGPAPKNLFGATKSLGVDLFEDTEKVILKCQLGFEKLPFDDGSVDYLTAYDVLEHIPRFARLPEHGNTPFIFLMNECYRVLKEGGVFLSKTPVYPYHDAFQDPTHNNIMTVGTLKTYFSNEKVGIASHYGITTNFKVRYQRMLKYQLIAVLEK